MDDDTDLKTQLLQAIMSGDGLEINRLATMLLVTQDMQLNQLAANELESFIPCRIIPQRAPLGKKRCYVGFIQFYQKEYAFGWT